MDCVEACNELGPWGPLVFGFVALLYGVLKNYQAARVVADNLHLKKALSDRPAAPVAPQPVVHVYTSPVPSMPPPSMQLGDDEQTTVARVEPPTLPPPRRRT